jgi:Zn-dependent protease with chaperone function
VRIAACLLIASFLVAVVTPHVLSRLTCSGRAPGLGVAAWVAAIGGVGAAWVAAPVLLALDFVRPAGDAAHLAQVCLAMIRTALGTKAGSGIEFALAAVGLALVAWLGWRLGRVVLATARHGRRHAAAARIIGRRVPGVDAVVVDATDKAAYCLAGRPGTVVVTRAALEALTDAQLAAVLDHERAHLAGRHHLLLTLTGGLARACPRVRLFTVGAVEVARLLEMCADDAAARRHGRIGVVEALLALGSSPVSGPAGALGAAGPTVLARAERLLAPAPTTAVRLANRVVLAAATAALLVGPIATVALSAAGINLCSLPTG